MGRGEVKKVEILGHKELVVMSNLVAGGGEAWRPDLKLDLHGFISVVMCKAGISAPGPDDLRFAHLQSLLAMSVGIS